MNYIELELNIRLKETIKLYNLSEKLSQGINKYFKYNEKTMDFHKDYGFKLYNYSLLTPIESDKLYKKGKVYNLTVRFMNKEILNDFYKSLIEIENSIFSIVNRNFVKKEFGEKIKYIETITPSIITVPFSNPVQYLDRKNCNKGVILKQLTDNSCKKYSKYLKNDTFYHNFIEDLEVLNNNPLIFSYKKGVMIGNKFRLKIKEDELSQKIAFLILGCGLAEKNSLSYGFCKAIYEGV